MRRGLPLSSLPSMTFGSTNLPVTVRSLHPATTEEKDTSMTTFEASCELSFNGKGRPTHGSRFSLPA